MMDLSPARAVALGQLEANLRTIGEGSEERVVLVAGASQYGSVWARDFCFASGGLLAAKLTKPVLDTLTLLAAHQRKDGLYPRMLDSYNPFIRFVRGTLGSKLPLTAPLAPNFVSDHFVLTYDTNALVIDAICRATLASGDSGFGARMMKSMDKAILWCRGAMRGGLIKQPPFSDWKDTIAARRGKVFFTQLQYWKALGSLTLFLEKRGEWEHALEFRREATEFGALLRKVFWVGEGGYFKDTDELTLLSTDGNLAAIAWGFATPEETERILYAMDLRKLWTPWGPRAGERYSYFEKGYFARLALVHGYQDDFVWLWLSALALRALHRAGRHDMRDALLATLCERIVEEDKISEVYRPEDGREVRTWLYRSEAPFSWSSGMLLEAFDELDKPAHS